MTFKIKDGIRVGTTDVFDSSGVLQVGAPKFAASKTVSLTGAVTGSVSSDFTGNVTINTTMNTGSGSGFVSAVTDGIPGVQTGSSALTITTTGTGVTIAHADTSTLTGAQGGNGIAGFTIDGLGHITAVTTATYLTAEADTLATVTGRGATTSTAVSITNATASSGTGTGALVVTGGVGIGGAVNIGGNLVVSGNLTLNGTTTTVNSTTVTIDDPIFTLGGDTAPATDDNKDRGIEFRWHNGTAAKVGFFGFDDSTGKFTFIPDATNTSEVFSGATGILDVASITGSAAKWTTSRTVTFTGGDVTGSFSIDGSADVTSVALTVAANSVALGTNTTGNYVATVADGTPSTQTGTSGLTITAAAGAGTAATIAHANTSSVVDLTATSRTYVTGLTFDTFGHVTAYTTGSETVANTTSLPIKDSGGTTQFTATDTTGLRFAGAGIASVSYTSGSQLVTITATEADTLATVTGRGATTTTNVQLNSGAALVLASSTASVVEREAVTTTVATANVVSTIDSWAKATYRVAKYLITVTQGTFYQTSQITVFNDGTTAGQMTETHVFSTAAGSEATFTIDASGANVLLRAVMPTATSTTYKISRTLIVV